jgi:hypothetical protein
MRLSVASRRYHLKQMPLPMASHAWLPQFILAEGAEAIL